MLLHLMVLWDLLSGIIIKNKRYEKARTNSKDG